MLNSNDAAASNQMQDLEAGQTPDYSNRVVFMFDHGGVLEYKWTDDINSLGEEDLFLYSVTEKDGGDPVHCYLSQGKQILQLMNQLQQEGVVIAFHSANKREDQKKLWEGACASARKKDVDPPTIGFLIEYIDQKGEPSTHENPTIGTVTIDNKETPCVCFVGDNKFTPVDKGGLRIAAEKVFKITPNKCYIFDDMPDLENRLKQEGKGYHACQVAGEWLGVLQQAAEERRKQIQAEASLAQENRPAETPSHNEAPPHPASSEVSPPEAQPSQPEQSPEQPPLPTQAPPKPSFWRTVAYVVMAVLSLGVLPAIAAYRRYVRSSKDSQAEASDNTTGAVPESGMAEQNHLPRKDSYFSVYRGLCDSVLPGSSQDERKNTHGVSNR